MNGKTKTAKLLRRAIATGLALTLGSPVAAAMPQGGKVLAGGAGYTTAAGAWVDSKSVDVMNLHDGDKLAGWTTGAEKAAVIQWDSFDIASGEKLIIAYESGPMVNIVKSGAATTISGAIEQWNTKPCYIVNANGIDITAGAGLVKASNLFFPRVMRRSIIGNRSMFLCLQKTSIIQRQRSKHLRAVHILLAQRRRAC